MSLFARANAGASLTPGERAALRFMQGLVAAVLVAALPILAQVLAGQPATWGTALDAALPGLAVAVLLALSKYFTAQGDAPLAAAAGAAAGAMEQPSVNPPAPAPAAAPVA